MSRSSATVVSVRSKSKKAHRKAIHSHDEQPKRVPVTQQFIARCLAAEQNGVVINHPAKHLFADVLYNSIVRMVRLICFRYSETCKENIEDLMQECFLRITKRIGTYDYRKALFSTWCWSVCVRTMNSHYRQYLRQVQTESNSDHIENYPNPNKDNTVLADDITDTICRLVEENPGKRRIIYAIFGNPKNKRFCLPSKVNLAQAAQAAGVKYHEAYLFYKGVVQKMFEERFAERSGI